MDAYLDIETTGLSSNDSVITVVGVYRCNGRDEEFIQLHGENVTRENLLRALEGVTTVYTYNGSRFDLPFIKAFLGMDVEAGCTHDDLMYHCWRHNLKGGFKVVEARLGIKRETVGVSGLDAVLLWYQYRRHGDNRALRLLLKYNKEDTVNLRALREKLAERPG